MTQHDEWTELEALFERYAEMDAHAGIELNYGSNYAWSGELRLTLVPNRPGHKPDRSAVFFSGGGCCPEEVITALLVDVAAWEAEPTLTPEDEDEHDVYCSRECREAAHSGS